MIGNRNFCFPISLISKTAVEPQNCETSGDRGKIEITGYLKLTKILLNDGKNRIQVCLFIKGIPPNIIWLFVLCFDTADIKKFVK